MKETFMLLNEIPAILLKMLRTGGANVAEYFETYVTVKAKFELVKQRKHYNFSLVRLIDW